MESNQLAILMVSKDDGLRYQKTGGLWQRAESPGGCRQCVLSGD